ncbi:MAG: LLM class flavin-dependent oxidoreductase [Chloroflexi bacterium]|nr:LLM class flavin-dependent oxidoreductase [Chloroflexota bacterium]
MDDMAKRFAALSPEQRALLELRLKQKGLQPSALDPTAPREQKPSAAPVDRDMRFTLFFFSDQGSMESSQKYSLLLESAKFGDEHNFGAIWTPERHFQDFGGLYPNPSVLGAALAMITKRMQIRAGSVALPLHNPIRVAEEWSVVDNLSNGRVGVSFASGWHPRDFVLSPESYANRKALMYEHIQTIRRLWAGESLPVTAGNGEDMAVRILPRPIQEQLPIWITTSGSVETFVSAGEIGANILTSLSLTSQPFEELAHKIKLYREALALHGHDPRKGIVSVMLHTFLGTDETAVKQLVREPMRNYLRTYVNQFDHASPERRTHAGEVSEADKEMLLDGVFERYFATGALLGTPEKCTALVDRLQSIGVNEIGCLIDFGLDTETVVASLPYLNELKSWYDPAARASV